MNYDIVYVNGDSYSIPREFKIYGEHIADYFNAKTINKSVSGSSNSRIFRTSVRDLIELKNQKKKVLACISLSFIMRTEIWDIEHQIDEWRHSNDGDFFSIQPFSAPNWFEKKLFNDKKKKYTSFCKEYAKWYNVEAETVKLIEKIVLFVNWCENNNVDYIIFSPMYQESIDFDAPFVKSLYQELVVKKYVLDIFNFSFLQWCIERKHKPIDDFTTIFNGQEYQIGHMGASGHKEFAEFLLKKYFSS